MRASPAVSALDDCGRALARGEYSKADETATAYIRLHPRSAEAHILLARAHMGLNQARAAFNDLYQALKLEPKNLDALYYCSKLSSLLGNDAFVSLSQIAPDSARIHQITAEGLAARGDNAGAEREYKIALEKRPDTESIITALGDLKRFQLDFPQALNWYERALARNPKNYDALYGMGACYLLTRVPEKAVSFFQRALSADNSSLAAKMALGEALLVTGKAQDSVPLLEDAAKADPNLKRLQYLLGRAYQQTGRTKEAQQAFRRYRELGGEDAAGAQLGGMTQP